MVVDLLLIFQVIIVLMLIFVVMLQKTGSDTLSGLSASGPALLSSKSSGGLLKKATVILAIAFMLNSIMLSKSVLRHEGIVDSIMKEMELNQDKREENLDVIVPKVQ